MMFFIRTFAATGLLIFLLMIVVGCYEEIPLTPPQDPTAGVSLTETWESPWPTSNVISDIWVDDATGTGICVCYNGTIFRFSGQQAFVDTIWSDNVLGVWGISGSSVYACGSDGTLLHFDGSKWDSFQSNTSSTLTDIWGISDDDVFAVGFSGTIMHYDGQSWSQMESPVNRNIFSVWGSSSDNFYAVGLEGLILHYDGATWDTNATVTAKSLRSVWGFGEDTVYAVGDDGKIVIYDAHAANPWTAIDADTLANLNAVWGSSSDDVFAASLEGKVYHKFGELWPEAYSTPDGFYSIGGTTVSDNIYFCGENGSVYQRGVGGAFGRIFPGRATDALRAIWGLDNERLYVAGDAGVVLARQGSSWRDMYQPNVGSIRQLWGAHDNAIFAAAQQRILRFNGHIWTVDYFEDDTLANYITIWGRDARDVYAAGDFGKVIHYDGSSWKPMDTGIDGVINVIRGDTDGNLYTAGQGGIIMKYRGDSWREMYSNDTYYFFDLLVRSSTTIFAVGRDGYVFRFDGKSWSKMPRVTGYDLLDIWGFRSDELFVAGRNGTVIFYNGDYWFDLSSEVRTNQDLLAMWGEDRNRFFVVGEGGTILKYDVTFTD
jgi:hypothetical protein